MKSKSQIETSASRGKKALRATGVDNSSYGETSARSTSMGIGNPEMKGSVGNLSHSITGGAKVKDY
jgi:hypothetical protein